MGDEEPPEPRAPGTWFRVSSCPRPVERVAEDQWRASADHLVRHVAEVEGIAQGLWCGGPGHLATHGGRRGRGSDPADHAVRSADLRCLRVRHLVWQLAGRCALRLPLRQHLAEVASLVCAKTSCGDWQPLGQNELAGRQARVPPPFNPPVCLELRPASSLADTHRRIDPDRWLYCR